MAALTDLRVFRKNIPIGANCVAEINFQRPGLGAVTGESWGRSLSGLLFVLVKDAGIQPPGE